MDILGSIKPPVVSVPVKAKAVVLPKSNQGSSLVKQSAKTVDVKAVEDKRIEVLQNTARSAPQPLGSQVFTLFKDSSGQMVTRYRDQGSGKVTYIPEPDALRRAQATSGSESLVNIKI